MRHLFPSMLMLPLLLTGCGSTATQEAVLPIGIPLEQIDIHENERNAHSMYHEDVLAAEYASAGDVVILTQSVGPFEAGTLLLYFNDTTQDESDGQESFGMVYSLDDGQTWSDRITVPIASEELPTYIAADASIIQLEDGTLLLYFYALDPRGDHNKERLFYAASSTDGLTFTVEQEVFRTSDPYNSPDVVVHDNQWYLFLTIPEEGTTGFAVSDNSYDFEAFTSFSFDGIPGVISDGDSILLYDCSRPMGEWKLADGTPSFVRNTAFGGCVPSPYIDQEGNVRMVSQR